MLLEDTTWSVVDDFVVPVRGQIGDDLFKCKTNYEFSKTIIIYNARLVPAAAAGRALYRQQIGAAAVAICHA